MTDDELLKALRDTVRAEDLASHSSKRDLPASDAAFVERMTDLALSELSGTPVLRKDLAQGARAPVAEPRSLFQKTAWAWPLAAAAVVLFALLRQEPPAPLAPYRVEIVQGSERTTRDALRPQDSLALRPGLPFELTLRPASQLQGPLRAEVYLSQATQLRAVPVEVEVSGLGVVHLRGRLPDELDLTAQDSALLVSVGRPGALPTPALLQAHNEIDTGEGFQTFRLEIRARQP